MKIVMTRIHLHLQTHRELQKLKRRHKALRILQMVSPTCYPVSIFQTLLWVWELNESDVCVDWFCILLDLVSSFVSRRIFSHLLIQIKMLSLAFSSCWQHGVNRLLLLFLTHFLSVKNTVFGNHAFYVNRNGKCGALTNFYAGMFFFVFSIVSPTKFYLKIICQNAVKILPIKANVCSFTILNPRQIEIWNDSVIYLMIYLLLYPIIFLSLTRSFNG